MTPRNPDQDSAGDNLGSESVLPPLRALYVHYAGEELLIILFLCRSVTVLKPVHLYMMSHLHNDLQPSTDDFSSAVADTCCLLLAMLRDSVCNYNYFVFQLKLFLKTHTDD